MSKINIDKLLQEIGGIVPYDDGEARINNYTYNPQAPREANGELSPIATRKEPSLPEFNLNEWQQEIYNHLNTANPSDLFINILAAAGKTTPIVRAWRDAKVNRNVTDRILWITPTIQLADQIYKQDLFPALVKSYKSEFPDHMTVNEFNIHRSRLENMTSLRTGQAKAGPYPSLNTAFSVCTYPFAIDFMRSQEPNIIVIDEAQEYAPIEPHMKTDLEEKSRQFVDIMSKVPRNACLIFLTGSMNRNTATQIYEFLNKEFGRNFTYRSSSTARNRAYIQILPFDKMRTADEILTLVRRQIYDRSTHNAIALFSVRNEEDKNKFKKAIIPIAQRLVQQLPPRSIESITGRSPSVLHGRNESERKYHEEPQYQTGRITPRDAERYINGDDEDPQNMANWLYRMTQGPKHGTLGRNPDGEVAKDQPDPLLAHAILCGFAYLAGGKERDRKLMGPEIRIVQTLFRMGKINSLLATDTIGVGTTLSIANLYIPQLQKPGGGINNPKFWAEMDDSSLLQLLHRAGRKGEASANIYCSSKDYPRIVKLFNSSHEEEMTAAVFGGGESSIEKMSMNRRKKVEMMFRLLDRVT